MSQSSEEVLAHLVADFDSLGNKQLNADIRRDEETFHELLSLFVKLSRSLIVTSDMRLELVLRRSSSDNPGSSKENAL